MNPSEDNLQHLKDFYSDLRTGRGEAFHGGGGQKGLQAMRIMFQHLGANILAREILTTYDKPLNKNSAIAILQNLTKLSRA